MTDVYRPLFVMVEAVEAEARRLLAQREPQPSNLVPQSCAIPLPDVMEVMRLMFNEPTLSFQRSPIAREVIVGHRCRVCRSGHSTSISDEAFVSAESVSGLLVERVSALLEAPCPDLGVP